MQVERMNLTLVNVEQGVNERLGEWVYLTFTDRARTYPYQHLDWNDPDWFPIISKLQPAFDQLVVPYSLDNPRSITFWGKIIKVMFSEFWDVD